MFVVVVFLSPALRFKCESLKHNCMLFLFTFIFILFFNSAYATSVNYSFAASSC